VGCKTTTQSISQPINWYQIILLDGKSTHVWRMWSVVNPMTSLSQVWCNRCIYSQWCSPRGSCLAWRQFFACLSLGCASAARCLGLEQCALSLAWPHYFYLSLSLVSKFPPRSWHCLDHHGMGRLDLPVPVVHGELFVRPHCAQLGDKMHCQVMLAKCSNHL